MEAIMNDSPSAVHESKSRSSIDEDDVDARKLSFSKLDEELSNQDGDNEHSNDDDDDQEEEMEDVANDGGDQEDEEMVKVYLRFRPHVNSTTGVLDYTKSEDDALVMIDGETVESIAPKDSQSFKNRETGGKFSFTKVFDKPTSQEELFACTTETLVDKLLMEGKDGLLFAYGVTNAGKTHTVEGTEDQPGIIPRTLQLVFDKLQQSGKKEIPQVDISYLQVYNEQVHDLQVPPGKSYKKMERLKIKLRDDGVEVEGLKATPIQTCEEGLAILNAGREVRTTHETQCNLQSSRSHSVFVIQVENVLDKNGKPARLYIVDLAGSERAKRTLTSRARQREASNINCSLMNLMRCLDTLRMNQRNKKMNKKEKMVPFRESKLTLLFRDCFIGGNCGGVAMIVNASTRPEDYDETVHALKYSAKVKNVQVARAQLTRRPSNGGGNSAPKYGFDGRRIRKNNSNTNTPMKEGRPSTGRLSADMKDIAASTKDIGDYDDVEEHPIISALMYELAAERMHSIALESKIREEVAAEMAQRLQEMESTFHKHVDAAKQISESKSEMMLKNLRKRINEGGKDTVYTKGEIEALVQNIEECEDEMQRMRNVNEAEVKTLKMEIERLQRDMNSNRRRSTEKAHRESFERLDAVVLEHLDTIARYKEELEEERALHEKAQQQLQSAMQLTLDYQNGEAEKQRQIYALTLELEQLKKKTAKDSSFSSAASASFSSAGGLLKHVTSSPHFPRPSLSRKSRAKSKDGEVKRTSQLAKYSSAPPLDNSWKIDLSKNENDDKGSEVAASYSEENEDSENSSFKGNVFGTPKRGLMSRLVDRMRK